MSIFNTGKLLSEIDLSNRFCKRVERNFNAELEHYKREFKMLGKDYSKIFAGVNQQLNTLKVLEKIYLERENSQENFSEKLRRKSAMMKIIKKFCVKPRSW